MLKKKRTIIRGGNNSCCGGRKCAAHTALSWPAGRVRLR
jgi:hypothetical protein